MAVVNATITSTNPVSPTDIITVSGGQTWANIFMTFCNFDTTNSETITVYVRPVGESAANENTILKNIVIDPTDTFAFSFEKLILSATDKVSAIGTAGSRVSVTASYIAI